MTLTSSLRPSNYRIQTLGKDAPHSDLFTTVRHAKLAALYRRPDTLQRAPNAVPPKEWSSRQTGEEFPDIPPRHRHLKRP
jgi:hypothetical protein